MDLYIFDKDFNRLGMIDKFSSLRWLRSYNSCGLFELNLDLTLENIVLLQKDNIIYRKDDVEVGVINYINYKKDTEGKEVIVCKGNFATTYLSRRISLGTNTLTGTEENAIRTLITNNVISATNNSRNLPNFLLGANNSYAGSVTYVLSNIELLQDIMNLAVLGDLGFRTSFNATTKRLTFNMYKGLDRSVNQSVNPRCIFSQEFDNILESEFTDSNDNYKNVAYSTTSNSGTEAGLVGLNRYEMFADSDLTVALSQRLKVMTFISKINSNSNLTYKVDYDLGDVITCTSKKWNVTVNNRIMEVEEVYEEAGLTVNLTLGERIPTLITKIKQLIKK